MRVGEIIFTPDSRAVTLQKLQQIQEALGTLVAVIGHGKRPLDVALPTNILKVAEFELADLGKTLGIETDSAREREERFTMLRAANLRVRELEAQLGDSQGADVTQVSIKELVTRLDGWWDLEGFGLIRSVAFDKYGCGVSFSCSLQGDFSLRTRQRRYWTKSAGCCGTLVCVTAALF